MPESRMELVTAAGLADRVIAYSEPVVPFTANFKNLKRGLRRVSFDLYLDLNRPEDEDRRLLASLGGARVRMGNTEGEDFPYLNWEIKSSAHSRDEVRRSLSMLSWIQEPREGERSRGEYSVSVSDRLWLDDFLLSHSALHDEKRVIVDLSLPKADRGWSADGLADVLRGLEQLCSPRLFVVQPPETESREVLFDLSRHVTRQVILVDEPILRTASLMERSDLILSSKSDLFSLAYALRLPSVLLVPEHEMFFPPVAEWVRIFRIGKSGKLPSGEIVGAAAALMEKKTGEP